MKICIKDATILDTSSPFHGQKLNLFIEKGIITDIGSHHPDSGYEIIESPSLFVSPGWFDLNAGFCDPGYEQKENLSSGAHAAVAGGFSGVALQPSTPPIIDNKSLVEYIASWTGDLPLSLYPIGAITTGFNQKDLSEMMDMAMAGAIAFSNGHHPTEDSGVLLRALQYVKSWEGLIMNLPEDRDIAGFGQMNDGSLSTKLGLSGRPSLAEEMMVWRDITLTDYSESRLHFSQISSADAVTHLHRNTNPRITASVTPFHLTFTEEDCRSFDTNYKTHLPLHTKKDQDALWQGLMDGSIEAICSGQQPQDQEAKNGEFDEAATGMNLIEIVFPLLHTHTGASIPAKYWAKWLSANPSKIAGKPLNPITKNLPAHLTLFDTQIQWEFKRENMMSHSQNCPIDRALFSGKVIGVVQDAKAAFFI